MSQYHIDIPRLPQEILKRYQGEIDRFVNDTSDCGGSRIVYLADVVRQNSFKQGTYVGFQQKVWKVAEVRTSNILTDPPTPGGDRLRLELADISEHPITLKSISDELADEVFGCITGIPRCDGAMDTVDIQEAVKDIIHTVRK